MTPVELDLLLDEVAAHPDCRLLPPAGQPPVEAGDVLPPDLVRFYERCGGAVLHGSREYGLVLHGPSELVRADPELLPEPRPGDRSEHWYLVASGVEQPLDRVVVDLHPDRAGRCYDAFWDVYASPGDQDVVADSFGELVRRALEQGGTSYWWPAEPGAPRVDAYDGR